MKTSVMAMRKITNFEKILNTTKISEYIAQLKHQSLLHNEKFSLYDSNQDLFS